MASVPSLTEKEKAQFLQALREDPNFREEVRRVLLEELQASVQDLQTSTQNTRELLDQLTKLMREGFQEIHEVIGELSRQIQDNSQQIRELTQQVQENSRQIQGMQEAIRENSRQVAALTDGMERVEAQIAKLTGEVQEHSVRLADVSGVAAEAGAYQEIDIWLRNWGVGVAQEYLPGDLQEQVGVSSIPDRLMLLKTETGYVFLVCEVTFTVKVRDVRRVAEWLDGFRKLEWPAIGLVYFRRALPEEDIEHYVSENGREVIRTQPGMQTLRAEATEGQVLLMQHGASPWRPEGWQPPEGMEQIPDMLASTSNWS